MRIGLIDTMDKSVQRMPNSAIASLAAYLVVNGLKVEVLDLYFADGAAQQRFFRQNWGLIGITATSFSFPVCREAAQRVKQLSPSRPPVVVGGPHASVAREEVLKERDIDFAVYGEGEIPLLSLAKSLAAEEVSKESLRQINGLIFRDGDQVLVNPPQERIGELDALPLAPYDLFPMDRYDTYSLNTARGCPFSCVYCASEAILGRTWVAKTPGRMVEEIEYLLTGWGKKPVYIIDDTFNLDEDRVQEFCRLLLSRGVEIEWNTCGMRADRTNPEMLRLMRLSGCVGVSVGVESANPKVLKNIGKGENIEAIWAGIRRLKEAGISVCAMFMIGNPGDTRETVLESIAFAKSLAVDYVRFYQAVPFPHTRLWQFVKEHGRFLRLDYENFHDFSEEPLFETPEFTFQERVECYKTAAKVMFPPMWQKLWRSFRSQGIPSTCGKATRYAARKVRAFWQPGPREVLRDGRIMTRFSQQ